MALPDPDSVEYHAERLVLIELCVDPPARGDEIDVLGHILQLSPRETAAAVAVLEYVGLARRDGTVIRATESARYFEHLCPITF
ncbi:MAG TPA: hypothetical protein VF533_02720 [Solirubrobacteraceae bacterium]|jgi:hypothetical protein